MSAASSIAVGPAVDPAPGPRAGGRRMTLFTRGSDGHRLAYVALLEAECAAVGIRLRRVEALDRSVLDGPVFFPMLDEDMGAFLACCAAGLITGHRVTGLFFRPGECFRATKLKYRLKRALFALLSRLPRVQILTIMPFSVDPRFASVASGWVQDPQMWDGLTLTPEVDSAGAALRALVQSRAAGRRVVVALGGQNRGKGFDRFCATWAKPEARDAFLFVSAGKVAAECRAEAEAFDSTGGLLIDRYVTDGELTALYETADLVWAVYSPLYDQASGIAGRAYQAGAPCVVREGAYVARVLSGLGHPVVALPADWDDGARRLMAARPARVPPGPGKTAELVAMRDRFRDHLRSATEPA